MAQKPQQQQPAEEAKKGKPAKGTLSRFDAAALVVRQLTTAATLDEVNQLANELFVKHGGVSDPAKGFSSTRWAVQVAEKFGLVKTERTVTIHPAAKS